MPKLLRLAVLVSAAATALAFAASAFATPRLIIGGSTSQVGIQFLEDKADAAPARIAIYAPAGYSANLTGAAGSQLGTVHADLQALAISPDAIISADGQVLAANPAQYATNTCAPGTHNAVWLLHVTVSGQTIDVPAYVDAPIPAGDPLAGSSPMRIIICFSSPYVSTANGGAPFGVKIVNAVLSLNSGVVTAPTAAGSLLWRVVITPYTVGTSTPNAAGTVEARAVVDQPDRLSIVVKVTNKKKRMLRITGRLSAGEFVLGGATVKLTGSAKASKKTNNSGTVVFDVRMKKKGTYRFRLTASVPPYDVTSDGCKPPTAPTLTCVSATANGFAIASRTVTVKLK